MDLSAKIRVVRLLMGFDQRDLALAMGMKSATHLNRWEQGVSSPRPNMLKSLGKVLEIYWPWFLDSTLPFTQQDYLSYRPLSPYIDYTCKWLTLMPKQLVELLPDFLNELHYDKIFTFSAQNGGGVLVGTNGHIPLMITCREELFPALIDTLSITRNETITDTEFAEQLFKGGMTQELFGRSGVNAPKIEPVKEPPPKVTVYINLTASISNTIDIAGIQTRLDKKMQELIDESDLEEVKLNVSVTASKSTNQYVREFVVGKNMNELAKLLSEKISSEP